MASVSVIVPVRNGEPYLRYQLQSLASQQCSFDWEVIVVDNGSTDGSGDTARGFATKLPNLQVLCEPRAGKSYALNAGIAAASGEKLVLVDADDEVAPGYLESMAAELDRYEMVMSRVDVKLLNPVWCRGDVMPPGGIPVFLHYLPYIPGALIGVRAPVRERIGEFATDLSSAEDVDFTWRASRLGVKMGVAEGATLHWRRPADAWGTFRKARSYGRSHVWLYLRYRELGQQRRSGWEVVAQARRSAGEVLRHEPHWQWRLAGEIGYMVGRMEESLRYRVWFP